jgi:uncharacterized damage-inducible protein DinB
MIDFRPILAKWGVFMRRHLLAALLCVCFATLSALAQQPPPPAPTASAGPAAELLREWNAIGRKLIEMAEDFPEEKYDYKPTPEVRSFAEHLLHTAGSNFLFVHAERHEPLGPEDLPRETYKTKADIVAVLKKSFAEGATLIQQAGDNRILEPLKHPYANRTVTRYTFWMDALEHAGEHYGSLVVYYRLNGMIPPASRPRPR